MKACHRPHDPAAYLKELSSARDLPCQQYSGLPAGFGLRKKVLCVKLSECGTSNPGVVPAAALCDHSRRVA